MSTRDAKRGRECMNCALVFHYRKAMACGYYCDSCKERFEETGSFAE